MPTTVIELADLAPVVEASEIFHRCVVHGYTGVSVEVRDDADGQNAHVTINEGDDAETMVTNILAATVPTLSVTPQAATVSGDGVSTVQIDLEDSRGAAAQGKVIQVTPPAQPVALSPTSIELDAAGQGSLTFGPSAQAGVVSAPMPLLYSYENGDAEPVAGSCQFT